MSSDTHIKLNVRSLVEKEITKEGDGLLLKTVYAISVYVTFPCRPSIEECCVLSLSILVLQKGLLHDVRFPFCHFYSIET